MGLLGVVASLAMRIPDGFKSHILHHYSVGFECGLPCEARKHIMKKSTIYQAYYDSKKCKHLPSEDKEAVKDFCVELFDYEDGPSFVDGYNAWLRKNKLDIEE